MYLGIYSCWHSTRASALPTESIVITKEEEDEESLFSLCPSFAHSLSLLSNWLVCENRFNLIGGSCFWSFLFLCALNRGGCCNQLVGECAGSGREILFCRLCCSSSISSVEMKGTIETQSDILPECPPKSREEPRMSWFDFYFCSCRTRTSTIHIWQLVMVMSCHGTSFHSLAINQYGEDRIIILLLFSGLWIPDALSFFCSIQFI